MRSYLPLLILFGSTLFYTHQSHAVLRKTGHSLENIKPQQVLVSAPPPQDIALEISDFNDHLHYLYTEKMQLSALSLYQQDLKQGRILFSILAKQLDVDDYDQMSFINNYATLLSNYAELLDQQHCYQQSLNYWQQSDQVYQAGKIYQKEYPTLAYNHSLNFARQSVFYRKNSDQSQRLALLTQAERISAKLIKNNPDEDSFQLHHLNVLLDQLDIYQQQANSYSLQKQRFDQLTPYYFKVLKQQSEPDNFGNTIIFIQKYYRYLFIHNPQQATQWLKQQHSFIENYRHQQQTLSQREKEFLAGYYALNRQFTLTMFYLNQLDPNSNDATAVHNFKNTDPLYANIRFQPEFQTWLANYEKLYAEQQKQCQITEH